MSSPATCEVIVAIGDLHGHASALDQLLETLRSRVGLFDRHRPGMLRRGAMLVLTGDYIDRGTRALEIIETLQALKSASPCQVVALMGNHELMALEAYDTACTLSRRPDEAAALRTYGETTMHGMNGGLQFVQEFARPSRRTLRHYVKRMAREGDIGSWMRSLYSHLEAIVAGRRILFTHADLTEHLRDRAVLDEHLRAVGAHRGRSTAEAGGTEAKYGHPILMSGRSVFWNRSFRQLGAAQQQDVDDICRSLEVDYVVTGHTPHRAIKCYGGRIFNIDVGMTPLCGGNTPQALVFSGSGIVGLDVHGRETRFERWSPSA